MNYLAENALPIWVGGAVLLTLAVVVYSQLRSTASLLAILVVLLLTAVLLMVERFVVTPGEAVERTLYDLADAVENNDVPAALTYVAPGASEIRTDIETVMPLVRIEKANIVGTPKTIVEESRQSTTATVTCRGFVQGTLKRDGMKGGDFAELEIRFVRIGDRWLVEDYSTSRDWRREIGRGRRTPLDE